MAGRKPQHDAEYFPFYAKDGRTLFMLQTKFGLEGIGFFTNLLRLLCTTPHHYLDLFDPVEELYTWAKIGINDSNKAGEIISLLVSTGKIDRDLWTENRVIYSQDFVDSLAELYAKRTEQPMSRDEIKDICSITGPEMPIAGPGMREKPIDSPVIPISGAINTQRKVSKERKEEKGNANIPEKNKYGPESNVLLTEKEYSTCVEKYGLQNTSKAIEKLTYWLMKTGKNQKSHYACINSWVWEAIGAVATESQAISSKKTCPDCGSPKYPGQDICPECLHDFVNGGKFERPELIPGSLLAGLNIKKPEEDEEF